MRYLIIDRLRIAITETGAGAPLVLVHGSWDTHAAWARVVPGLVRELRVIRYDRRGHGNSECPPGQGVYEEDVNDLCQLLDQVASDSPAHLMGHSYGATIALLAAAQSPHRVHSVLAHEPPLFGLLKHHPQGSRLLPIIQRHMTTAMQWLEAGRDHDAARYFADHIGFGDALWDEVLTPEMRESFVAHADTWLDQAKDPTRLDIVPERFATLKVPVCLTTGSRGLPWYPPTMEVLHRLIPDADLVTLEGAGHAPHLTHPRRLVQVALAFIQSRHH
ncbi:alpha/beta fold hydrolase [Billgrantia endophytica]|uniref:Alpha/beta hydrolase n=1 Tax=Billgrantia endophytica TaxID=2033802 RepID=A0A2N7U7V2_9GAMM|nr:alpha/beta hydrolase [Halomonas endophytica]PMR76522.1 alpha/beta hydrolase [Halomonas endophytica]